MRPEARGYTLVEAVLALALAGLVFFGCVSTYHRLAPKFQLRSAVWEVTSGLQQARFRAILSGAPVRVRFSTAGYVFERFDGAANAWRTARTAVLPGVAVRANNSPVFHPQGTVSDLTTIHVSNVRGAYRVTVAITGRVKATRVA